MTLKFSIYAKRLVAVAALLHGFSVGAQSAYQGVYQGYAYLRTEGAVTQPEYAAGIAIAEVMGDGSIRLQDTDNVGTVDPEGTITWNQPNEFFLSSGSIADGTLAATGSTTNGLTTTFTRLDLKSGSGFSNADSLDDYFSPVNPTNPMSGMVRVIHDGSQFVALSSTGAITTSTDGASWQTRSTGSTVTLTDLAYGAGTWLAVGESNTLLTSTDLVNWTPRASGIGSFQNYHVTTATFFNGKFYVANLIGTVARSLDSTAATWETVAGVPLLNTNRMRTLNGRIYYTGKSGFSTTATLLSSTDGATFTAITLPGGAPPSINSMAFGGGKVFINGGSIYFTSTDGTTFARSTSPINFGFVGFDGRRFVGRGLSGTNAGFRYSTEAVTWETGDADAITGITDLANAGGEAIAVGAKGKRSTDGITWTNISTSAVAPGVTGSVGDRIVFGNGIYILHGAAGSNYITRDGVSWAAAPAKSPIAFGNGVFVSNTDYSVNGLDWFPIDFGSQVSENVTRVAFDGTSFLATTSQGKALVSTNGASWTHANPGSPFVTSHSGKLAGADGKWIILGTGGAYSRSLDGGVTWTSSSLTNATLNGVAYGNGRWVIGSNNGRIYAGSTLAALSSVGPTLTAGGGYDSVVFIDGQFFVRRNNFGTYFVSDGLSGSPWIEKTFGLSSTFFSAAVGPDFALVSGQNDLILRADLNSVGHPVFTSQPALSTTLTEDATLNLSASVIGNAPFTYKWYRNGVPLTDGVRVSGADTPQLSLSAVRAADVGNYMLLASNAQTSTFSAVATLAVNLKPIVLSAPDSVAAAPGSDAVFTVEASPDTTAIQWLKNGVPIDGQTSATLNLTGITQSDAGFYQARLTNTFGDRLSPVASLSFRAAEEGLGLDAAYQANLPVLSVAQSAAPNNNRMAIRGIHEYADGKVLIGGQFGYMVGTEERYGLIRLNADGSRDTTFNIPILTRSFFSSGRLWVLTAAIWDFAVLSDGRIMVIFLDNISQQDGEPISSTTHMMFDPSGSPVSSFPISVAPYASVAVDSQDRIILSGPSLSGSGSTLRHIVRYSSAGVLDLTFDGRFSVTGIGSTPSRSLAVTENDSILAVGIDINGRTASRKLTSSGTLAPGFTSSSFSPTSIFENANTVQNIKVLPDGGYFVIGSFGFVNFVAHKAIARFSADGTLDTDYRLGDAFKSGGTDVVVLPDKNVLMTGGYSFDGSFSPGQYLAGLILTTPTAMIDEAVSRQIEANAQVSQANVSALRLSRDRNSVFAGRFFSISTPDSAFRFAKFKFIDEALPGAPALAITSQTPGAYAEPGEAVTFAVSAVGGGLKFQWRKNGVNLPDETNGSLTISPVGVADAGNYSVVVTDATGSVTSAAMPLTVPGSTAPPTFNAWQDQYTLPPGLDGFDQDANGDGVSNGFKFLFDLNPLISASLQIEVAPPSGDPKPSGATITSANNAAGLSSPEVEAGKTYQIVSFRMPADLKGTSFDVQPSTGMDFDDGSANAYPFGNPVPDGDFLIHSYYLTPATQDAAKLFWRLMLNP